MGTDVTNAPHKRPVVSMLVVHLLIFQSIAQDVVHVLVEALQAAIT